MPLGKLSSTLVDLCNALVHQYDFGASVMNMLLMYCRFWLLVALSSRVGLLTRLSYTILLIVRSMLLSDSSNGVDTLISALGPRSYVDGMDLLIILDSPFAPISLLRTYNLLLSSLLSLLLTLTYCRVIRRRTLSCS